MLQKITLPRKPRPELLRKPVHENDARHVVEARDFELFDDAGNRIACLFSMDHWLERMTKVCRELPFAKGRRLAGVASGSCVVFGYTPKTAIQTAKQTCSKCAIHRNHPDLGDALIELGFEMSELMLKYAPEKHAHSKKCVEEILPQYRIPGCIFTSGIANKSSALAYHYDRGNFEGTWSAMLWIGEGFSGGGLILPDLDAKIPFRSGAVLLFDGQSELHGVTPIQYLSPEAYRYSIVYYSLRELKNCKSPEEERRMAQIRRTPTEMKRAGLLKEKS